MTLLLNLLASRTTSASGGDSNTRRSVAPAGTLPSRTWPPSVPPLASHMACTARSAMRRGSGCASGQWRTPQAAG